MFQTHQISCICVDTHISPFCTLSMLVLRRQDVAVFPAIIVARVRQCR